MVIQYFLRASARKKSGGDLLQAKQYCKAMKNLGCDASISYIGDPVRPDCDIIHLFNLDRPWDSLRLAEMVKLGKASVVLSAIHHPEDYVDSYQKVQSGFLARILRHMGFTALMLERMKGAARAVLVDPSVSTLYYVAKYPCRVAQQKLSSACSGVLFLAEEERRRVNKILGHINIPNAIIGNTCDLNTPTYFSANGIRGFVEDVGGEFILIVGRIEARKNQIRIIKALEGLDYKLVFVGALNPTNRNYCKEFIRTVSRMDNCVFMDQQSPEAVGILMQKARVHVSASFMEVSSLVDIEAAAHGTPYVYSLAGYRDYDDPLGEGCSPYSEDSIRSATTRSLAKERRAMGEVVPGGGWSCVGRKLLEFYTSIR